jgi:MFS superfamily sulfate permease-like transporter
MTQQLPVPPQEPGRLGYVPGSGATGWQRWVPGLQMLARYQRSWLGQDLAAGLVLTAMLVPVGIAYAEASGVPGIYGLYATIIPLLAYALFGPSRILVLGPDSSLVVLILAVVFPLSQGDPGKAVILASAMALVSGTICIAAGLLRLGFITELLSKPIRYGYMNGIALTVVVSQLPKVFGFSIDSDGLIHNLIAIGSQIITLQFNVPSLLIGVGTIAIIFAFKRFPRVPGVLIAVVAATVVTALFDLDQIAGVKVLGTLPQGLPSFVIPWITLEELRAVAIGGLAVALVSFADTSVLSRTYAAKTRSYVNPNQEMIGLGAANLAAGFFQGFPISSSSSRTPVAEAAGAKTQLTGVVGALCSSICPPVHWPRWWWPRPSACSRSAICAASIASRTGNSGCRSAALPGWPFWAPFPASGWRLCSR